MAQIDFSKIFLNDNGEFRHPEEIAESILLIKDIGQAQSTKISIMDWLKENEKPVCFVPEIKAVHDYAREIAGIGTGEEIREEDFLILMENCDCENLNQKFKNPHYRNYKKSLLKLLNLIDTGSGSVTDQNIKNELEMNGLYPEIMLGIMKYINSKGYYFKAQILSKASTNAQNRGNIFCLKFFDGEFSVKEKEFINASGAVNIDFSYEGKYSALADVFKGKAEVVFDPESVEFIVSVTKLDEARKIKHFILQSITKDKSDLGLNDFTVVCQDEENFRILNNYFYAERIPVYSSYKYSGSDINTDVLRLFKAGAEGDAQTILNFFNLYIADEPLSFGDLTELDLKTLIAKLFETKNSDYKIKAKDDNKKFIKDFLKAVLSDDLNMSSKKALTFIKAKIRSLKDAMAITGKKLDTDIYTYESTVERIFGDNERKFSEYLEYIYIIAAKTNSEKLNKDQNGVRIIMIKEPAPAGRVIIFSGLTEENFLKSSNPIKILSRESYFRLYKTAYGTDPDRSLYENLRVITSGKIELAAFFVPQWGEETIPSTKLDRLFELYPKVNLAIKTVPEIKSFKNIRADFSITLKDKLSENEFGKIKISETKHRPERTEFGISLKTGKIEDLLVSPSKIESFMACPAAHVHDLNLEYDKIESQITFTKGNFYHKLTEAFLKSYKGFDLLNEYEYNKLVLDLSEGKGIDAIAYSRYSEFPDFFFYNVKSEKFNDPFETFREKIERSGIQVLIKDELEKQKSNDPYSYYAREKLRSEIIRFLAWLMIELGPTPSRVTSTFETEVKFTDFKVCELPGIYIKRGYIDFIYVDFFGTVRIIDIKSNKKFEKFEEEIEKYQKVQILFYREALSRRIKKETGVNLLPDREDIPQDKDCTILQSAYFDKIPADAKVEAVYYSPSSPYRLPIDEQTYSRFLEELNSKLKADTGFKPDRNSKCEYCSLSQSCPDFDESKFEKIEGFDPDSNARPQSLLYEPVGIEIEKNEDIKKIIVFKDQKAVAVTTDDNTIVSAGAGAGKTEVLSSKYINLLLTTDAGLENIVCITFTKKAAGEMQKRIYSKISDIIESCFFIVTDKEPEFEDYKLTENRLKKLKIIKEEFYDKNLISTFHAFCNKFITEYGYFSKQLSAYDVTQDLSEDFLIGEESVKYMKLQFSTRYKNLLVPNINEDEYKLFDEWLWSRHLIYSGDFNGGFIPDLTKLYQEMKLSGKELTAREWSKPLDEYLKNVEERKERFLVKFKKEKFLLLNMLEQAVNDCGSEEKTAKLRVACDKVRTDRKYNFGNDIRGNSYAYINDQVKLIKAMPEYKIMVESSVDLSLNDKEWVIKKAVFSIIRELDDHINEFKKQKGLLEQSDLHIHFLEMLKDEELKKKLQSEFKFVLVDEFQDTNRLQDRILDVLKGEQNRFFFVGDKKQSIYRFQQCDVQIFEKYMKSFNPLYFTDNYRSVPQIVKFNNSVFDKSAPNGYDIIKKDEERSSAASSKNKYPYPINFVNIEKPKAKDIQITAGEISSISKMCEAAFVTDTIIDNIKNGQEYGSWAVLIRKYSHIGYITEAFRKKNIPYTLILKKGLFELNEVKEYILILKAVLGIISPEEIEFVPGYRNLIASLKREDPLISIIFSIAEDGIYKRYIAGFEDCSTKKANIEIFKEMLISLLSNSESDRERFFTELEKNIKNNSAGVAVENSQAVTIMTVHSAKGLEFDNLILANVDENDGSFPSMFNYINLQNEDEHFIDISAEGYSTPDGGDKRNFFINEYIKYQNKFFDEQERANLLYVALTRAKKSLTVMIQTKEDSSIDSSEKREGWAKYLRQFGQNNDGKIEGFQYLQKNIKDFDLSSYFGDQGSAGADTYQEELEYELTGHIRNEGLVSATGIAHEKDEVSHEKGNTVAIDTGNFVHLFMSKKIKEIFRADFNMENELKEFKKKESEPSSASLIIVRKMIENIKSDQLFRKYAECGRVLCEKNIVDARKNLQGYIDLVLIGEKEVAVIDYKTYLNKYPDEELIGKYKNQVRIYADALSKIYPDKIVRKYLFFIGKDKAELKEI